jgi:hypothetical protein
MHAAWLLAVAAAAASAGAPEATDVVERVRAVLEPARPSVRRMTIRIQSEGGEEARWEAAQARKALGGERRILTVLLAPEGVRGVALMVGRRPGAPDVQWLYLPTVRRVRKVVPAAPYQSFLGTDFTLADFGFVGADATYRRLGTEEADGRAVHRLEEVPRERWYYGRIVWWIAADSGLPLRREFHAPSGELWKVETFEAVSRIDGVPTPLRIRMEDVREKASSEIAITDVRYDEELPDALFDPQRLPDAVASPAWTAAAR